MRQAVLLFAGLAMLTGVPGQEPGTAEARLFGAEGHDEATAVWADQAGIFVAGETTSDIVMADGQALWAPGGPPGRKGFVTAFDTALHWSWSFSFAGDPEAPVDAPSAVAVRDVVRSAGDPAVAWVLYDAPVQGQWESVLLGVHPSEGVVARHAWSTSGAVTSVDLVQTGSEGFIWVGRELSSAAPEGPGGIRLGFWDGQTDSAPSFVWLAGADSMTPIAADWHNGTLCIAALTPEPDTPSTVLLVEVVNGNPVIVGTAPIPDAQLTLVDVAASAEGVAWSATRVDADGTADAVFGKLAEAPDPDALDTLGHAWIQVTAADEDQPARSIQWAGDVVQCAMRTKTTGEGGTGIRIQRRFSPNGAWFGEYTFGGPEDEELGGGVLDHAGRSVFVGSSSSWTDLGAGNGSHDAVLFRLSSQQLQNGFETTAEMAVLPAAAFVGLASIDAEQERGHAALILPLGAVLPFEYGQTWAVYAADGRREHEGSGGGWTCRGAEGWRTVVTVSPSGEAMRRRVWVAH